MPISHGCLMHSHITYHTTAMHPIETLISTLEARAVKHGGRHLKHWRHVGITLPLLQCVERYTQGENELVHVPNVS